MRKTKQGVSLIVLVITIIIMIILASAIIVTLSNSDIIDRANEAVEKTDLQEVQNIASIAWSEAYLDGKTTKAELQAAVENALTKNKVDKSKYALDVTTKGVKVLEGTLGNLIKSADDYGKTVDYTVTVDGTTYDDWQVFYEDKNNGYVFLISKDGVTDEEKVGKDPSTLTSDQKDLYDIFNLNKTSFPLTSSIGPDEIIAGNIDTYSSFANIRDYGTNVIGAIGGPTLELFAAAYNEKYNATKITPIVDKNAKLYNEVDYCWEYDGSVGYFINEVPYTSVNGLTNDNIYLTTYEYWIISQSASTWDFSLIIASSNGLHGQNWQIRGVYLRPVVCLSSDIPANYGTTTDFSLTME